MIFELALNEMPEKWGFSHLMAIEPSGFQCNLLSTAERAVVSATGDTPAEALVAAMLKTCDPKHYMPLYDPSEHASDAPVIRDSIDIAKLFFKPMEKIRRPL